MPLPRRSWLFVLLALLVAALFRAWLIGAGGLSFDSDEAVVGLMARHINQAKPVPTFFYGQDYMGSLDALLVAAGFRLAGESVTTIRLVQAALYLLTLGVAYRLAQVVTGSRRVAAMALLLLAIPTALGVLYTSITLGGYNELVLSGSLVLLFGWQVTLGGQHEPWRWAALGLAAGLGWWTNGAIITACAVVVLLGLRSFSVRHWRGYGIAALAFMLGSAPWWAYNLRHDWAALTFLVEGFEPTPTADPLTPGDALLGLLLLGLPALYGLRLPWEAGYRLSTGLVVVGLVYLVLLADLLAHWTARHPPELPSEKARQRGRAWVWLVFGVFGAIFIFSSFPDATGRYLMPLWIPAAIGLALGLDRLRRAGRMVAAVALGLLLAAQAGIVIHAAHTGTGLTPQLVERLRTSPEDDEALLDFLAAEGYTHGYASYWASFRLIFRSHEAVILDTTLPYDYKGFQAGNNRYPPYSQAVARAERVVWITQPFPELDTLIAARLAAAHITYQSRDFGGYRVYYDFSRRVAPADVGLDSPRLLSEQWSAAQ